MNQEEQQGYARDQCPERRQPPRRSRLHSTAPTRQSQPGDANGSDHRAHPARMLSHARASGAGALDHPRLSHRLIIIEVAGMLRIGIILGPESAPMVCSSCTLLHPQGTTVCRRCGALLCSRRDLVVLTAAERAPTIIGIASGVSLLACLALALLLPAAAAAAALQVGAYSGIVSITNMWLSVYRGAERAWLQGVRSAVFSSVLFISLAGELARLQGMTSLQLPGIFANGLVVPVPSAAAMELIAGLLIVGDPLVVRPVLKWIADGVEHAGPE